MTDSPLLDADVSAAVGRLVRPWSDVLSPKESGTGRYIPIDYPPLLDMLDEACRSNIGGVPAAGRSDPATRNLIDLDAHALRETIDATVRAWISTLSKSRPLPRLKDAVVQVAGILHAHHAAGTMPDSDYDRMCRHFPRWCDRIWSLFDPPIVKDLIGVCPNCAESVFAAPDGVKSSALVAYYWKGIRPEAKCRRCGEQWTGERQLLELGYHLGATVDEETLREMGVI